MRPLFKYPERYLLANGEAVHVRPVGPADREALETAFDGLSPESRYLRFFSPRKSLSEKELTRLTSDGEAHFALTAVLERPEEPVGIAHLFRSESDEAEAEVAVTIADKHQGRGLGELLFRRLIAAALERDIERLRFEVLYENEPMRHLIKKVGRQAKSHTSRGVTSYLMELDSSQAEVPESALGR